MTQPIRAVVVEDSPTQRAFLKRALEADGDISVVGEAATAVNALAVANQALPDVVTMDLDIPGGGIRAIEEIMASAPSPILLLSGRLPGPRSPDAICALGAGAAGVLAKPRRWDDASQQHLRNRVRSLSRITPSVVRRSSAVTRRRRSPAAPGVVGIGASTGGPAALSRVLGDIGPLDCPVLCVQHIDGRQVEGLAGWLSATSGRPVRVARNGDELEPGAVLLGPGDSHLTVTEEHRIALVPDAASLHTPSVDELLLSIAAVFGDRAIGCVLTGMGSDGALGMEAISNAGGFTIVQDAASSVVHGMAGTVIERGFARRILPIEMIGLAINRATRVER